jgi:hypothetical protein
MSLTVSSILLLAVSKHARRGEKLTAESGVLKKAKNRLCSQDDRGSEEHGTYR